ncbi:hypothetical protein [Streptomyces sp. SCL15-4]|uniref:hypothetical protein n=1 Tax=Streptomyces sp. SCL15-4 TaxID=2967221 RepID=UPI0029673447|nr:hypothetical protein [Streptomyces sp. SCL15-4]
MGADRGRVLLGADAPVAVAVRGVEGRSGEVAQEPLRFSLLPADVCLPDLAGVRCAPPAEPAPLYTRSLLWRAGDGHSGLRRRTAACAARAGHGRWLEYDPARDRLPEPPGTAWARQLR